MRSFSLPRFLIPCLSGAALFAVSAGEIVLSPNASAPERYAAELLRGSMEKVWEEDWKIVPESKTDSAIHLGQSPLVSRMLGGLDFSTLKPDEIIVRSGKDGTVLTGAAPRGTIYAVQEYLERGYGARFLTASAQVFPRRKGAFRPPELNIRYAPPFAFREMYANFLWDAPAESDLAVRMRLNGSSSQTPDSKGGHIPLIGWVHTFGQFVPAREYFQKHPEYYAELNGRRNAAGQLCLTTPGCREAFLKEARKRLAGANPDAVISVSQDDNQLFCRCSRCADFMKRHGNQTDLLLDFVNWIAERLEPEFPHATVETLAYLDTQTPPKTVRPRSNVMIRLCSMNADQTRPLDSDRNAGFRDALRAWSGIAPRLFVWNYVTNFSNAYQAVPNWDFLAADLRFFAAHKTEGVFEQGNAEAGAAADFGELRFYLISKLLWDPSLDPRAVIEDFCRNYYGPASPGVIRCLDVLDSAAKKHPELSLGCYSSSTKAWLDAAALRKALDSMTEARAAAAGDPAVTHRVEAAALSVHFMLLDRADELRNDPLFRGIDWEKMLDSQLEIAARPENMVHALREGGKYQDIRPMFARKLGLSDNDGVPPAFVGKRRVFLRAIHRLGGTDEARMRILENNPRASLGKEIRMPTTNTTWLFKLQDFPVMRAGIYAELRCRRSVPGGAVTVGVYDLGTKKEVFRTVPASEIAGPEYRWVKIFSTDLNPESQIFIAPADNPPAGDVWIDRIMIVDEAGPAGDGPLPEALRGEKGVTAFAVNCASPSAGLDVVSDPASASGLAVRMPARHGDWLVQWRNLPSMNADLYAEVRCDSNVPGNVMTAGIYDAARRKEIKRTFTASELSGPRCRLVKIGSAAVNGDCLFFVSPISNPAAGALYVDRLILVERK